MPIQMLMIRGLFKDTLSSLRHVYTSIMLDSVQFRSTYDYLETWLFIVTTTDSRTNDYLETSLCIVTTNDSRTYDYFETSLCIVTKTDSLTYDYSETSLCIVTTTNSRTIFQIHFQATLTFHL